MLKPGPLIALAAALLAGCALERAPLTLRDSFSVPAGEIVLAPDTEKLSEQDQALAGQLTLMLETRAETEAERAELFYQLGIIYDRLGLEATARTMFMNAVMENPSFAAPYNFIGIYFAKDGRFQDACDAFDSALELNPRESFIYLNRAIVLHYARRDRLALQDLLRFYEFDPDDPYRLLWLFIVEYSLEGEEAARDRLQRRYLGIDPAVRADNWGFNLVKLYLGTLDLGLFWSETKAYRLDPETLTDHLCEAYFYLGKLHLLRGEEKLAYDHFYLSQATRRYGFLEYRYALTEIELLEKRYQLRAPDGGAVPRF